MEGDVEAILPRPTLPSVSPDPNPRSNNNVHRYASRDLRIREAEAEIEKWDAWHACAGMSNTEAKRKYISTLIETMKEYASGTQESRELVSELEFVWNQIRSQSGSDPDEDGDSPTRQLERAGLRQTQSFASNATGQISAAAQSSGLISRTHSDPNRMRVLSPVSQRDSDDVVEAEEVDPNAEARNIPLPSSAGTTSDPHWKSQIESHLRQLSIEVAALREELSANHLLSSSSLSPSLTSRRRRLLYRITSWVRWLTWIFLRQAFLNVIFIIIFILWARWKGQRDRKVEHWAKRRYNEVMIVVGGIGNWVRESMAVMNLRAVPRG